MDAHELRVERDARTKLLYTRVRAHIARAQRALTEKYLIRLITEHARAEHIFFLAHIWNDDAYHEHVTYVCTSCLRRRQEDRRQRTSRSGSPPEGPTGNWRCVFNTPVCTGHSGGVLEYRY